MIKIIFGVFFTVFLLISVMVILYWRDINFDPRTLDLAIFFGLLPIAITALLVMPFVIKNWLKEQQQKKEKALQNEDIPLENTQPLEPVQWINLNVFSAYSLSSQGEDAAILEKIKAYESPELDPELLNSYGLPILSFRIPDLDAEEDPDSDFGNKRQSRIHQLIAQQLEQQTDVLWSVGEHLKKSALFYDTQLIQEYRMHPAWIDPQASTGDNEDYQPQVQQVSRLSQLKIHIILPGELLHIWDETSTQELIADYLNQLGYVAQVFHVEHHYWGSEIAYSEWIDLLKQIELDNFSVSLVITTDSEIDQDTIDEKIWVSEQYIPAEYISSVCISKPDQIIDNLIPVKQLKIAKNAPSLKEISKDINFAHQTIIENEQPFIMLLDDISQFKNLKKIEQNFSNLQIEQQHYLMMYQSVGQTQSLSKIFGFNLALQFPEDFISMVYTIQSPDVQTFIQQYQHQESEVNHEKQHNI